MLTNRSLRLVLAGIAAIVIAACGLSPGIDLPNASDGTGSAASGGSTSSGGMIDTSCGGAGGASQLSTGLAGAGGDSAASQNSCD